MSASEYEVIELRAPAPIEVMPLTSTAYELAATCCLDNAEFAVRRAMKARERGDFLAYRDFAREAHEWVRKADAYRREAQS